MVTMRAARSDDVDEVLAAYEWLFEAPGARPVNWDPTLAAARFQRTVASDRSVIFVAASPSPMAAAPRGGPRRQ
jgi:hypothetical protein